MLFAYALTSVLAVSAVFGHSSKPTEITYEELEVETQTDQSGTLIGVEIDSDARAADLKFVLAIQNSSIWTNIKMRTTTISTNPRLTALLNESPENLSDHDLALLRRACHDGLKCVAVDQLLVLTETLDNGTVSVRKVITKITHVLTKYTTEYHEDTYQYEEVTETDDPSKVNHTVTVIVQDNKELCRLDVGGDSVVVENEIVRTDIRKNEGNVVGGAAISFEVVDDSGKGPVPPENDVAPGRRGPASARDRRDSSGSPPKAKDHEAASSDDVRPRRAHGSLPGTQRNEPVTRDPGSYTNNSVGLANGGKGAGDSLIKTDITSAGDFNDGTVKKGYVENGVVNNGDMKVYNINGGTINKGVVNRSAADGGIINVGTLNNGATNYGTANNYENYGTEATVNSNDVQQYLTSVDQMYSAIINGLANQ